MTEAILAALGDEELHWTVIWDRALRAGAIAPGPEARPTFLRALKDMVAAGTLEQPSKGTYRRAPV